MQQNSNRRLITLATIVSVFVFGALLITLGIHAHQNRTLTAKITVQVTPASAKVTLNGKGIASNGHNPVKVKPGTYTVVASLKGFATTTRSVTASKNQTAYVGIALSSNSAATANWYATHSSDEHLLEDIGGKVYNQAATAQSQQNPIIQYLPFIDNQFRIDYGVSVAHPHTPGAVGIYITYYSPDGLQQALNWIKFKGFDPGKLEIIEKQAAPVFDVNTN